MPVQSAAPQTDRKNTALWLHDNGYPILPVAPAQPADQYPARNKDGSIRTDRNGNPVPAFTGKNPSYLDKDGNPHLVNHQKYQTELPTKEEFKVWFANPNNGIGTLGGWNNTVWLDFDTKHFESGEAFNHTIQTYLDTYPHLKDSWQEWTHSGGFRLAVRVVTLPTFTNFALTEGGEHVGEALCQGRFTVLAPTVGPSGEPYICMNRAYPVEVASLESIGIYPVRKEEPAVRYERPSHKSNALGGIPLDVLGNDASKEILNGRFDGDRSSALTKACNEWFGWENWAFANKVEFRDSAEDLAYLAGERLGLDKNRVTRILRSIDASGCQPACVSLGGDESAWQRVRKVNKAMFDAVCPQEVKNVIDSDYVEEPRNKHVGASGAQSWTEVATDPETKGTIYDGYMREINSALACSDPNKRDFLLARIAPKYHIKASVVENAVANLQAVEKPKEQVLFSLKDFLNRPKRGLQWIVPGFLPRGEMLLLSGAPKAGKSLLVYELIYQLATGGKFLGLPVPKCKALIIQLDEGEGSIDDRIDGRGIADIADDDSIMILQQFDINRLQFLEEVLETFRPDVVVLDTLRKANHTTTADENSAEFAKPLKPYSELLRKYNAAGINIHHNNKSKEAKGNDRISGSTALIGAHWGTAILVNPSSDNKGGYRHLIVPGSRDSEPGTYKFERRVGEGGSWWFEYQGELDVDTEAESLQERIIAMLVKNTNVELKALEFTTGSIRDWLKLDPQKTDALYKALSRATSRGLIYKRKVKAERGRVCLYHLPQVHTLVEAFGNEPSPPYKKYYSAQTNNETVDNKGFENTGQGTGQVVDTLLDNPQENQALDGVSSIQTPCDSVVQGTTGQLALQVEGEGSQKPPVKDAKPIGKYVPPVMDRRETSVKGETFKVGDRVTWASAPSDHQWINQSGALIIGVTDGLVRLEMGKLVPVSEIQHFNPTPWKLRESDYDVEKIPTGEF